MNFDVFENDPAPPTPNDAGAAISAGQTRRARRRAVTGVTASALALLVGALALRSPDNADRPVVADAAPTAAPCRLDDLAVSTAGVGVAAGTWGDRILFRNVGRAPCVLDGYPDVTGLVHDPSVRNGMAREAEKTKSGMIPSGGVPGPVRLGRGDVAEAVIEGSNIPPGDSECLPIFGSFVVAVPHHEDGESLELLGSWNNCGRLEVHPFTSGDWSSKCTGFRQGEAPRLLTIRMQRDVSGDGVNDRFEPRGPNQTPLLSAEQAFATLSPNWMADPVDAVLASWTDLTKGDAPRLVWVLRNQYLLVDPSMGQATCGESGYLVDARNGDLLGQRTGGSVFRNPTARPTPQQDATPTVTLGAWTGRRPARIYFSADPGNIAYDLTWTEWRNDRAVAEGSRNILGCENTCAGGSVTPYTVTLTLSDPVDGQFTTIVEVTHDGKETTERFLAPHLAQGACTSDHPDSCK